MAIDNNSYNMSFVAGAAMMNEMYAVAKAYLESGGDWKSTKENTFRENLMQKDKLSSNKRYFKLMKQRIETLNEEEIEVLVNSTMAIRRAIVLLAICKAHSLIYDFIVENLRDCFYNLDEKVSYVNFNEFYNEKKYEHHELEQVTDLTLNKVRQVIFRILEQTELVETAECGILKRPYLTEELERIIVKDNPKWLAIYLYSNNEISNLKDLYA